MRIAYEAPKACTEPTPSTRLMGSRRLLAIQSATSVSVRRSVWS